MNSELQFYWRLLLRRFPFILILLLVCTAIGLMLALRLPTTYESTARLLVQSQMISQDLAASTVQIEAREEIERLREQVLIRGNLIDIANDYDVYEDIREMVPDDIEEAMRDHLRFTVQGGPPVIVEITFRARTGQIAADVTNEIVTQILSANAALRTSAAGVTQDFFEAEVERLNDELEQRAALIAEFQSANADALPEDQAFRLQRQSLLQERLGAGERELRATQEARERMIAVFDATGEVSSQVQSPDEIRLEALQNELDQALTVFSETAPRVVQLRRQIEVLEARIAREAPIVDEDTEGINGDIPPLLALQLVELDARIDALQTEIAATQIELEELEVAIARSANIGSQLERLQRNHDLIQLQFDDARRALAQASIGERLEQDGQGQRITLLEPPVVPINPASPNRRMIAVGGVAMGLFLSLLYFMAAELANSVVRRPEEITRALGISPLASIPRIETPARRLTRRLARVAVVLAILVGMPLALWAVDQYYMPLELLADQIIATIGLT